MFSNMQHDGNMGSENINWNLCDFWQDHLDTTDLCSRKAGSWYNSKIQKQCYQMASPVLMSQLICVNIWRAIPPSTIKKCYNYKIHYLTRLKGNLESNSGKKLISVKDFSKLLSDKKLGDFCCST